jgi:RNA polymerase sigma factor (sigma-70 family)
MDCDIVSSMHDPLRSVEHVAAEPTTDRGAVDTLYARHWTELCNYVRKRFGRGPPDAEDVVQEAFIRFSQLESPDGVGNARAYLYRTAHNILVDEHRRTALRSREAELAATSGAGIRDERTPERVIAGEERLDILKAALMSMPETRRLSFLLHRLQGLSCAEIARRTGYSDSAIKKHIGLAMADLEDAVSAAERAPRGSP